MGESPTAGLIDDLTDLRRRTRRVRHGYWFPLLLFGLLTLGSIPLLRPHDWQHSPDAQCTYRPDGSLGSCATPSTGFNVPGLGRVDPLGVFNSGFLEPVAHPLALGLYWLCVLILGFLATVWWYRWRARRVGVETSTRIYAQVTVCGLAVLLLVPLISAVAREWLWLGGWERRIGSVALVAIPVGAVLVAMRVARSGRAVSRRVVGVGVGVTVLVVSVLGAAVIHKTGGLMLLAIGLLTLALVERSVWCTTVVLAFTGLTLLANASYMGTIFYRLNWDIGPRETNLLFNGKDMVLPGAVLVVGGLVALLGHWWAKRRTG
ncbi:hypothetical protein [Saccharothrix sp.]|uniref:hypothetical protein n=1 Tax=Saccharothrix sp. TaxID=1873460 RepID=UPI0028119170|nr:hypothetical protein [Saccharothrix sp.]